MIPHPITSAKFVQRVGQTLKQPSRTPKLVYIAGPFSADTREGVEANVKRAKLLGLEVAKIGGMPIVPHTLHGGCPELDDIQPYGFWIAATAELLMRCDGVLFTPDWQESSGALGEHEIAARNAIPCFFNLTHLGGWLHSEDLTRLGINWAN